MRDSGILKSLIYKKIIPLRCDTSPAGAERLVRSGPVPELSEPWRRHRRPEGQQKTKTKTKNPQTSHGCNVCADANSGPSVSTGRFANLG